MFTALLRALNIETRLIFSFQPLGFNFGKQEDAHRIDRRKDDLDKDVNDQLPTVTNEHTTPTKRKRTKAEDSDSEDLGLPKVKGKGMAVALCVVNGFSCWC